MRIGIVTHWNSSDNYGQQLQCYALQTLLRSWGHDAFLIRYAPLKRKKNLWQKISDILKHPENILIHLPFPTAHKRNVLKEIQLKTENDRKNPVRCFEDFRQQHLKMSAKIYNSYSELEKDPPKADIYITGSDQVWHDSYEDVTSKGMFLQFGDSQTKRISYAASIGRKLYDFELPIFRTYLSHFDAISVREESVYNLCLKLGIKAQICVDPTMLLPIETYKKLLYPTKIDTDYAFLYILNVKKTEDFYWSQINEYLSKSRLALKFVTGSGYYQGRELIEGNTNLLATVPEWLCYVANARCVFTTSFHGTVFSILMHRPFLTIGLQGKYSHSNNRMKQLLQKLGIQERMLDPQKNIQTQMDTPIDWEEVDRRMEKMRKSSLDFLKENL